VVSEKDKVVQELRNKLAAHDSPGGRSAREQQFQTKIEELQRSVEKGGEDARKLRQQVNAAAERLKEREKEWRRKEKEKEKERSVDKDSLFCRPFINGCVVEALLQYRVHCSAQSPKPTIGEPSVTMPTLSR
jgi:hypothetical protein